MSNSVPSTRAALLTLVVVTWRRLLRSRVLWVAIAIAMLPVVFGAATHDDDPVLATATLVLCILCPVLVAGAVAEEIEDRTSTYLWSRPLPRWTLLVGKLLALAPIATAIVLASLFVANNAATSSPPSTRTLLAFAAGGLAISTMSAGIGTLVPRHGMALSIGYFILIDLPVGAIPASVRSISMTRQVYLVAELYEPSSIVKPLVTMAVLSLLLLALGLWRLRRLEA